MKDVTKKQLTFEYDLIEVKSSVSSVNLQPRCFISSERSVSSALISNCFIEAVLQQIEEKCKCVPTYYWELFPERQTCTGPKIKCMDQLKDEMGSFKYITDKGINS